MNNFVSTQKPIILLDKQFPDPDGDMNDAAAEIETARLQDDQDIDFDDALDDDNENPVSHSLIEAAENRGEEARDDRLALDGEAEEDAER